MHPAPLVVRDGRGTAHALANAGEVADGRAERRALCGWPVSDGAPIEVASSETSSQCMRCVELVDVDPDAPARERVGFAREVLRRTRAAFARGACAAVGRHQFGPEVRNGARGWTRQCTRCGAEQEVPESWS